MARFDRSSSAPASSMWSCGATDARNLANTLASTTFFCRRRSTACSRRTGGGQSTIDSRGSSLTRPSHAANVARSARIAWRCSLLTTLSVSSAGGGPISTSKLLSAPATAERNSKRLNSGSTCGLRSESSSTSRLIARFIALYSDSNDDIVQAIASIMPLSLRVFDSDRSLTDAVVDGLFDSAQPVMQVIRLPRGDVTVPAEEDQEEAAPKRKEAPGFWGAVVTSYLINVRDICTSSAADPVFEYRPRPRRRIGGRVASPRLLQPAADRLQPSRGRRPRQCAADSARLPARDAQGWSVPMSKQEQGPSRQGSGAIPVPRFQAFGAAAAGYCRWQGQGEKRRAEMRRAGLQARPHPHRQLCRSRTSVPSHGQSRSVQERPSRPRRQRTARRHFPGDVRVHGHARSHQRQVPGGAGSGARPTLRVQERRRCDATTICARCTGGRQDPQAGSLARGAN
mmetsp:Transcript_8072/g.26648  ORF Transcript_8072/g.26648 Transcript_8072/m.26648 type:complete len:455 (-) Transcript_8072:1942-3306(-)